MGVCEPWSTADDAQSSRDGCSADDTKLAEALDVASDVLWRLSGHRWPGVCSETIRPTSFRGAVYGSYGPPGWRWQPTVFSCSCQARSLVGCSTYDAIRLPRTPVLSIVEVMIDGAVLDAGAYRIDDDRWLVRLPDVDDVDDKPRGWPCCQRLDLPTTAEGTWSVEYTWGGAPPSSGKAAAEALACEVAAKMVGDDCALDDGVTSVTREGITYELLDPGNSGRDVGFGIPEVRMFLEAVNPNDLRQSARVVNPDRVRRAVRPEAAGGS